MFIISITKFAYFNTSLLSEEESIITFLFDLPEPTQSLDALAVIEQIVTRNAGYTISIYLIEFITEGTDISAHSFSIVLPWITNNPLAKSIDWFVSISTDKTIIVGKVVVYAVGVDVGTDSIDSILSHWTVV